MLEDLKRFDILGVEVSAINMDDAHKFIQQAIVENRRIYVCICPVSLIMACHNEKNTLESVNSADLVTPDGMPVVWLAKMKGYNNVRRVYGPDLMLELCELSEKNGYRNYLYGSTTHVLDRLQERLKKRFPNLAISGMFAPPFRGLLENEDTKDIEAINSSRSDILWVGLGSPKQDLWAARYRDKLNVPVIIAIGAAFDFHSGIKPQAPRWLRNNGLEWLFRLATEPRRLWRRYLINNTLFVYYVTAELISRLFTFRKKQPAL